jgi:hypothetical protein
MAAGEGGDLPGYDGIIEATRGTIFVPEGRSVWELGTGTDPRAKSNNDYRVRTKDPLGINPAEATFVFVTANEFRGKREWADTKRSEGIWRDVRVFDVDDLVLALESAPAAHIWFSERIGKPATGVQTIEDWWSRFSRISNPPLTPELVLAGRADASSTLLRILGLDSRMTTVSAPSIDDVIAFIACVLLSSPEEVRIDLLARTVIVRDVPSLRMLDATSGLFILLPFEEELRREAQLIRAHHVIMLAPVGTPSDIDLAPLDPHLVDDILKEVGVLDEVKAKLSAAASRSLVAFQREASIAGKAPRIEWTDLLRSRSIRRGWLMGAWTEHRSGDLELLSTALGMSYEDAREELLRASEGADPLLAIVGDAWSAISPGDVWEYGHSRLTPADLAALEAAVQAVLGAINPSLDLPPEERWKAPILGKERVHSPELRRGLATSLALIGSFGDDVTLGAGRTGRHQAERIISNLLERANRDVTGHLWASLADVLPLLAEGAPDVFLRAVQQGVKDPDPLLKRLFIDQGDALTVDSPHTGLLWALETLAWSEEHLGLTADLLARLAEIDPGGRLSNRPAKSLADIFRPWLPQTSASAASRTAVLKTLRERHAAIAWTLLINLLPEPHAIGGYTHTPDFRGWHQRQEPPSSDEAE